MNAVWQVQEAKNRFSEMIEQALSTGPQVITRHGRPVVRVVAASAAVDTPHTQQPLTTPVDGFASYLLAAPRVDALELPVRRSRKHPITLGG